MTATIPGMGDRDPGPWVIPTGGRQQHLDTICEENTWTFVRHVLKQ